MIRINYNLSPSNFSLFLSIHKMILMNLIIAWWKLIVTATNLVQIINALSKLIYHYLIIGIRISVATIVVVSLLCAWTLLYLVLLIWWGTSSLRLSWTWNFITLNILLLLNLLLLILLGRLTCILYLTSLFCFILITLLLICIRINLLRWCLKCNRIIVLDNLFLTCSRIKLFICRIRLLCLA